MTCATLTGHSGLPIEERLRAGDRPPGDIDRKAMAQFVVTTMQNGVMQAHTNRNLGPFAASITRLRIYFRCITGTDYRTWID